jgi:thymidylate synthase (FAD)
VVDYMGNDSSIVQAARVSYGKGTKKAQEDRGLIRYLMRHYHTTPFEMCEIKLHIRIPMDAWRQWIRHRTASVNEYSTRYSVAIDSMQKTNPEEWRSQSTNNKQGSGDFMDLSLGNQLTSREKDLHDKMMGEYQSRLDQGVAREQARKDLPLSTYTEAYWKIDLHNLFHFLKLRMDHHAQKEIRDYATVLGYDIVSKWVPYAWEAFLDYQVNTVKISRMEFDLLRLVHKEDKGEFFKLAESFGWMESDSNGIKKHREREEYSDKLMNLGFQVDWANRNIS